MLVGGLLNKNNNNNDINVIKFGGPKIVFPSVSLRNEFSASLASRRVFSWTWSNHVSYVTKLYINHNLSNGVGILRL